MRKNLGHSDKGLEARVGYVTVKRKKYGPVASEALFTPKWNLQPLDVESGRSNPNTVFRLALPQQNSPRTELSRSKESYHSTND